MNLRKVIPLIGVLVFAGLFLYSIYGIVGALLVNQSGVIGSMKQAFLTKRMVVGSGEFVIVYALFVYGYKKQRQK